MKKVITKMLALTALVLFGAGNVNGQTEQIIFHETFNKMTLENTTKNALTSGNTDESDYVVGGGGSAMLCAENGTMSLTGGRFATKNMDLTGEIKLYVTYKLSGTTTKKFQIDIDKDGTSGLGGILNETGDNSPTTFETKTFTITTGTASSFIHFRTESSHSIILDEIKITKIIADPAISSFQIPYGDGEYIAATIDNENNTISAELPYGTDLTSIEPVITLQGTAKSYSPTGAQNFSNPVEYSIFASENASGDALKTYTVTLTTEQAASTDATLSSITINGTAIEGFDANTTEYSVVLPYSATMPVVDATTTDVAASIAEITQPTSLPADVTITVTAGDGTTTKTYTVNISMETAPKVLKEAVFSNGFNAFIKQSVTNEDGTTDDSQGTVTAYYLGTTAPTVSAEDLTCESGSAAIDEDGNIVVTGEDNTTKTFTVSVEAVEPQEASNATITFDGTETWIKNGYGYDSSKGWKFSKNVEEASNRRISEGKTRIYFFVGACKEVTLTTASGITSDRDITVAVNNVNVSSITKAPKNPGSITIPVNSTSPAMIEIKSNKGDGGGDGGFSSISIAPNSTTGLQQVAISSISFNGKQILNPEGLQVSVFDATGRMVINSNNTAISLSQGAYIVKAAQSTLKVIVAE